MERRKFLGGLFGAAAGAVIGSEAEAARTSGNISTATPEGVRSVPEENNLDTSSNLESEIRHSDFGEDSDLTKALKDGELNEETIRLLKERLGIGSDN